MEVQMNLPFQLSIIIVNYNSVQFLERCLASIRKYVDVRHEICVVDNASQDKSVEWIRKNFPDVLLIANECNKGFAAGINQGLKATHAPFILWLNPDTEFLEGRISEAIKFMESDPFAAILGLQVLNPDKSLQLSCRSFPSYETALFNRCSLLTRLFPGNRFSRRYLQTDFDHESIREVDWVSGSYLLHRRSLLDEIGFLDEQFFMYCEDVDFCKRAKKAGKKVLYYPAVKALHHIAGSAQSIPQRMILERHRSMWHYYKKHYCRNVLKDAVVSAAILFRFLFLSLRDKVCQQSQTRFREN